MAAPTGRAVRHGSITLLVWRWMPPATFTWEILTTTRFARSRRREWLRHRPGLGGNNSPPAAKNPWRPLILLLLWGRGNSATCLLSANLHRREPPALPPQR